MFNIIYLNNILNFSDSNRKGTSLIRMRLVHTGLNASLFITGAHENGLCEFCGEKETCRACNTIVQKYNEERKELITF